MVEAKNEALEAAASDPKQLARQLLSEGLAVDAVAEESGLSRPVVLGISGAMKKAQKRLAATQDKASPSENVGGETDLNTDLKREAQTTNNMVLLARGKQRLKSLDPGAYRDHYGPPEQTETSLGKLLTDIEFAKYIKQMREQETTGHSNNGDSEGLQKQIDDLRAQLHQKDVEILQKQSDKLEAQIVELRADLRSSAGSTSDLAVVVREGRQLLEKAITSPGPLRTYLIPDINIRKSSDAPKLQSQTNSAMLETLRAHGLVTQVLPGRAN